MLIPRPEKLQKVLEKSQNEKRKKLLQEFCKFLIPNLCTVGKTIVSCDIKYHSIINDATKLFSKRGWTLEFIPKIVGHELYGYTLSIESNEEYLFYFLQSKET